MGTMAILGELVAIHTSAYFRKLCRHLGGLLKGRIVLEQHYKVLREVHLYSLLHNISWDPR